MEIFGLIIAWLVVMDLNSFWGVIFGAVLLGFAIYEGHAEKKIILELKKTVQDIINKHIDTLALKYDQTTSQDAYGNWIFDKWWTEIDYFISYVIMDDSQVNLILGGKPITAFFNVSELILESVHARNMQKIGQGLNVDVGNMDPFEFERHCADVLNQYGWDARVTKASGDQGVDVVASLNGTKVVLQCKKYSRPVGNAAVQEAFAGMSFEQAHTAAVVTNASYTPSARQLASSTGVHLLHYSELPNLAERLGLAKS